MQAKAEELAAGFLQEAEDLLTQIEDCALNLEQRVEKSEGVHQLFRAFHTLKGSGAMFGFQKVADFTHHLENALDKVRSGDLPLERQLLDLILSSVDHIKVLLRGREDEIGGRNIVAALTKFTEPLVAPPSKDTPPSNTGANAKTWRILFRPDPNVMLCGTDPMMLLTTLGQMGHCVTVTHTEKLPDIEDLEANRCYFWWEVQLTTNNSLEDVKNVFIFVEDGSDIQIQELSAPPLEAGAPEEEGPVARTGVIDQRQAPRLSTIRVAADKLDRLVNLVGELVMNESRLLRAASRFDSQELAVPVEEIERLTSELRDCVLGIRMTPIGGTFGRFKRLVRDLSSELGKEIDLLTSGEETELDKTVLDQLGDPLVHLIRNSIDHGIESADERLAAGKSARGTITLSAEHTGSNVVVSIQDDGRGLNAAAIRAKAIDRRIIAADAALSEKEIFKLIFLPGFSTAAKVTNISGRGVGMDVVRRQVEASRGTIDIQSQAGKGTTVSLTLPLTLAIIDGLLVEVADEQFIIPMSLVLENTELHASERGRKNGRNVIYVRGEMVPYICLREQFELGSGAPRIEKVVIVRQDDQRVGLVVDRVLGSHQTVIQSLGAFYRDINVVSGATIMGDGRVALILSVPGMLDHLTDHKTSHLLAPAA